MKVEPPKLQLQHLKSIGFEYPTSFSQAKEMLVLHVCWIAREKRKKQKEYHGKIEATCLMESDQSKTSREVLTEMSESVNTLVVR